MRPSVTWRFNNRSRRSIVRVRRCALHRYTRIVAAKSRMRLANERLSRRRMVMEAQRRPGAWEGAALFYCHLGRRGRLSCPLGALYETSSVLECADRATHEYEP